MGSYLEAVAALGAGSLHPGGFFHTLNVLRRISLSSEDIVLDVGCGTGRTACYIANTFGAHVFALDNSTEMLSKARYRAAREGTQVQFVHGDAREMPFRNEVADLVFIESVLIFLPVATVLQECFRILKKGGILVDIEMFADTSIPRKAKEQIKSVCGIPCIPSFEEWLEMFFNAGFTQAGAWYNNFPGPLENMKNLLCPDPYQITSPATRTNWEINGIIQKYKMLIRKNRNYLGYGTFIMKKNNRRNT